MKVVELLKKGVIRMELEIEREENKILGAVKVGFTATFLLFIVNNHSCVLTFSLM